jgi:uncharacterized membrane protein
MKVPHASHLMLVLAVVALSVILGFFRINEKRIWIDEKISLLCATGLYKLMPNNELFTPASYWRLNTLSNAIEATKQLNGGNSILHTITGYYWIKIFGTKNAAIRTLSLLFGILATVIFYYWLISLSFTPVQAFAGTMIFSLNAVVVAYEHEFRAYTQSLFFTLAATIFLYKILKSNRAIDYVFYALAVAAAFLSHYFSVYILGAHGIIFILYARKPNMYLKIFSAYVLSASIILIWMLNGGFEALEVIRSLNEIYKNRAMHNTGEDNFAMPATWINIMKGWFQITLPLFGNSLQNTGLKIRYIAAFIVIPLFFLTAARRYYQTEMKFYIAMVALLLAAPVFATISAVNAGHIISFQPNYGIFSVPYASVLLLAGFIYSLGRYTHVHYRIAFIGIILHSIISFISVSLLYFTKNDAAAKNPYCFFAQIVDNKYEKNDTVIYSNKQDAMYVNLYFSKEKIILQKIDTTLNDGMVVLKKTSNENEVIFNFSDKRY